MEVARAFLYIGDDEYQISDRHGGLNDTFFIKPRSVLSIKWLGYLQVVAVVKEPFMCIDDEVEKYIVVVYCERVGVA